MSVRGFGGVATSGCDAAPSTRNDTVSNSVLELAKSVADGDYALTSGNGFGVTEGDSREIGGILDFKISDVI